MFRTIILIAGVFLALGLASPSHARAQEVQKLTEDNVREFIEKTTQITSGKEDEMTEKQIEIYLDVHLHPDANFKSTMRYAVPGFDVQEKTMSLDKQQFIEGIHQAASGSVSDYESEIEIDSIKISGDGKNATVKTQTHESGMMPVSDEIEKEEVPMEGVSTCTQILMLSDQHVIQMFNANCTTEIQFNTFDP